MTHANQNALKDNFQQQQQLQSQTQARNSATTISTPGSPLPATQTGASQRIINRNYLQIQSNNYNMANKMNTLNPSSYAASKQAISNTMQDPKRSKSISRSLRNLFSRSSTRGTITSVQKRDKSYDVASYPSNYDSYSG